MLSHCSLSLPLQCLHCWKYSFPERIFLMLPNGGQQYSRNNRCDWALCSDINQARQRINYAQLGKRSAALCPFSCSRSRSTKPKSRDNRKVSKKVWCGRAIALPLGGTSGRHVFAKQLTACLLHGHTRITARFLNVCVFVIACSGGQRSRKISQCHHRASAVC